MSDRDSAPADASTVALLRRVTDDVATLVRDEMTLAKDDISTMVRQTGAGAGMFGVAGVAVWFGVGALVAAAILGLAEALAPWLAALIVAVGLFFVAGLVALLGKTDLTRAQQRPKQRANSVRHDVQTLKREETT